MGFSDAQADRRPKRRCGSRSRIGLVLTTFRGAMQVPAKIVRRGRKILVKFPARHHLVRILACTWAPMLLADST
jgi:hypothetical protein